MRAWFEEGGARIVGMARTTQHGIDLIAECHDERWLVEAKGQTSSKPQTARFAEGFSGTQLRDHVRKAVFEALRLRCLHPEAGTRVLLALPDEPHSRRAAAEVAVALHRLAIGVFWVDAARRVRLDWLGPAPGSVPPAREGG